MSKMVHEKVVGANLRVRPFEAGSLFSANLGHTGQTHRADTQVCLYKRIQ